MCIRDRYSADLYLLETERKAVRRLTARGDASAYTWTPEGTLLFPALREEADKKKAEEEALTVFYAVSYTHLDPRLMRKFGPVGDALSSWLRPKVKFHHDRCVGCRACYQNCPAKAITMKGRYPTVRYHQCIRCYCCQELCPKNAISVRESRIMKLVNRL